MKNSKQRSLTASDSNIWNYGCVRFPVVVVINVARRSMCSNCFADRITYSATQLSQWHETVEHEIFISKTSLRGTSMLGKQKDEAASTLIIPHTSPKDIHHLGFPPSRAERRRWNNHWARHGRSCGIIKLCHVVSFAPPRHEGLATLLEPAPVSCLLYTSPSPRDVEESRMPSSA